MFSFFRQFFQKSVDSIIADITSKIDQLHIVSDVHAEAVKLHNAEIEVRARLGAAAARESARAKAIAEKLKALVS